MKKSAATPPRPKRITELEDTPAVGPNSLASVRWNTPAFFAIAALFFAFYFWTAQPGILKGIEENEYYNMLAEAFLEGHTSLMVEPRAELLKLPDPYDPTRNEPYRLHDASLYKGRYYLYFGATPVVTLFAPFRLFSGAFMPERLGCMYFSFGAFVVSCLVLRRLLLAFFPDTRPGTYYFCCVILGFVNTFPHLLRRPSIYETAIASGQFFLSCAVYVIVAAAFAQRRLSARFLLWGGVALGLAFGARPPLFLALPLAGLLWWFPRAHSIHSRRRSLAAFATGFLVIASAVAIYNYVRFDSFFEFGNHYQLAGVDTTKLTFFNPARLPVSLWFYVFCPPHFQANFPFVLLQPSIPFRIPPSYLGFEAIEGVLWACPLVLLVPGAWWLYDKQRRIEFAAVVYGFAGAGFLLMCLDGMLSATMRYMADFCPLFAMAALLCWLALTQSAWRWRRAALVAFLILALFGASGQMFISFTGYFDQFRKAYPQQYQALANAFAPLQSVLELFLPVETPQPEI